MIVFDIETVPTAKALAAPYPEADRQPPANYKSAEAIDKWRAADRERWTSERVKECSLNPRLGQVVAIALGDRTVHLAREEAEERTVLESFWRVVRDERQIAGWNSHGFDFPFLLTRSLLLGVDPGLDVTPYLRRYSHVPHFDAKMALLGWPSSYKAGEGLQEWSEAFDLPGKSGHGSEVYGLVVRGAWDELVAYAMGDAIATAAIVDRIAGTFGVREVVHA